MIDQRAYEDLLSSPTIFRALLWGLMTGYAVAFVALFSTGIRVAHRLHRGAAAVVGALAFASYQLVFVIFNR